MPQATEYVKKCSKVENTFVQKPWVRLLYSQDNLSVIVKASIQTLFKCI